MKHTYKMLITGIAILVLSILATGCEENEEEKLASIEYTVCEISELSENLVDIINDKKSDEFEITYNDENYTYLIKGYGKQDSGGYSITVEDVYHTQNNVCLETILVGPAENELVLKAATYPYIVVKIERVDKDGIFK